MAKLMCAQCGGKVKMAKGGTTPKPVLAKAKVQMYGIPQENLGTSGQYGFAQKGGSISSRPVKHSCPPGTVRSATGGCVSERPKFQKGGVITTARKISPAKPKPIPKSTGKKITTKDIYKGRNGAKLMKMGGTTKETKFAALAPPYDKATFADRIAGAKKKK
jgi:hypothetical protein